MRTDIGPHMSRREVLGGVLFFPIYIIILPFAVTFACAYLNALYNYDIDDIGITLAYYYIVFGCVAVGFRHFLSESLAELVHNFFRAVQAVAAGGVVIFVLNILSSLLTYYFLSSFSNPNDAQVYDMLSVNPRAGIVVAVFLAPIVEETVFRGLIFGGLQRKSRLLAYLLSCVMFGFIHIWQYAVINNNLALFLFIIQYIPSAVGLAWCYEKSGTIWAPIFLHMFMNGLTITYYLM